MAPAVTLAAGKLIACKRPSQRTPCAAQALRSTQAVSGKKKQSIARMSSLLGYFSP
jgi:hypothetical protein